jgi:hypothetical protein
LRYANNDNSLGIVLTPPHITEIFTEIANINKDSVVLDTCPPLDLQERNWLE